MFAADAKYEKILASIKCAHSTPFKITVYNDVLTMYKSMLRAWTKFEMSCIASMAPRYHNEEDVISTTFVKGIKNGCPCIVEIRGTQGCALVGDPARAVGECRDVAKAQP